jgi:hypothetical protein
MSEVRAPSPPIVCTLTAAELGDRGAAWRKVCAYALASEAVPGGVRITFAPVTGVPESLRELVRLEADCCPWMAFAIEQQSAGGTHLSVTAQGEEGERAIRQQFTRENLRSAGRPQH